MRGTCLLWFGIAPGSYDGTTQRSHPHQLPRRAPGPAAGRGDAGSAELWERVFSEARPGSGMLPDPSGCSLLVLLPYHQPLPSKGGDVAGGSGSCWELCVGPVPNRAEAHNGLVFFFCLFFIIYFLNYRLLLEVFWQQRGNGYMTTEGSVQINYPLNTTIFKVKE